MGQLLTDALIIKNETLSGRNTATRVGGWMEDAATAIEALPSAASFYDYSSVISTQGNQDVWTRLLCSATVGVARNGFSVDGQGIATYSGDPKDFEVRLIVTLQSPSALRRLHVAVFKNGLPWDSSEFTATTLGLTSTESTINSQSVIPLESGDTLAVFVKCSTHALSVVLDNLNVIIKEF